MHTPEYPGRDSVRTSPSALGSEGGGGHDEGSRDAVLKEQLDGGLTTQLNDLCRPLNCGGGGHIAAAHEAARPLVGSTTTTNEAAHEVARSEASKASYIVFTLKALEALELFDEAAFLVFKGKGKPNRSPPC